MTFNYHKDKKCSVCGADGAYDFNGKLCCFEDIPREKPKMNEVDQFIFDLLTHIKKTQPHEELLKVCDYISEINDI